MDSPATGVSEPPSGKPRQPAHSGSHPGMIHGVPPPATSAVRPSLVVRCTHWITAACFLALLVSGVELVISHPRFYWGEDGNVMTPSLFDIPIPSSRPYVKTGYGYVLPDQNGWSRSLHFQTAWIVVFTGVLYVVSIYRSGYLRARLMPAARTLSWSALWPEIVNHLRFRLPAGSEESYNVLQRLTYLSVIFVLFPLMIWTGLAMSPALTGRFAFLVEWVGGQQSARTIHFFASVAVFLFFLVHILMVAVSGFWPRVRAMIAGRPEPPLESL